MATTPFPFITPEKYLEMDRAAEYKSEYIDGVVYAMSRGRRAHSLLSGFMLTALNDRLRRRGCSVFNSDMRVATQWPGPYFYPDVSVVCGPAEFLTQIEDVFSNPVLVVEVLSKATEGYDRGLKFTKYRRFPSLRQYVLIWQNDVRIEVYTRVDEGQWNLTEFAGMESTCVLSSVACEIPLAEIYEGVDLPRDGLIYLSESVA